jgi:hypothetical protein
LGVLCIAVVCIIGFGFHVELARAESWPLAAPNRDENVTLLKQWDHTGCWGFALNGDRGFLAAGPYLQRIDITDPANPAFIDEMKLPAVAVDVESDGATAYVAVMTGELCVIDVSGAGPPTETGHVALPGGISKLALRGDHVFLTNPSSGLISVDVSGETPVVADSFFVPGAFDLDVAGNAAYVFGTAGLTILDISDPAAMDSLYHFSYTPIDADGWPHGAVAVDGSRAYALHDGGLQVIDVSNPASPVELGLLADPQCTGFDLAVAGNHVYATAGAALRVVDVSDPDAPALVGSEDFGPAASYPVGTIRLDGNTAYCTNPARGLQVIDIASPTAPVGIGRYDVLGLFDLVAWKGNVAAVGGDANIWLFDTSTPSDPDTLAKVPDDRLATMGTLERMVIEGDHLYLLYVNDLVVVDISNPKAPQLVDELSTGTNDNIDMVIDAAHDLAIIESEFDIGLLLINIADPENLDPQGSLKLSSGWPWRMALAGDYLYVFSWFGLEVYPVDEILEVSGALAPCGSWTGAHGARAPEELAVDVALGRVYAAEEDGLIRVIDVSDPCDPDSIGAYTVAASIEGMEVVETAARGAAVMVLNKIDDAQSNLYVLDASDPSALTQVGWFSDLDEVEELAVQGNLAIVTSPLHGFSVLQNEAGTPVMLSYFTAERHGADAILRWGVALSHDHAGFFVYREDGNGARVAVHADMLRGTHDYECVDHVAPRGAVRYWLEEVGSDGTRAWLGSVSLAPATESEMQSSLGLIRPNPCFGQATIEFSLHRPGQVHLAVYDIAGRLVTTLLDGLKPADHYRMTWDGRDESGRPVPTGVYLTRLDVGGVISQRRVLLSR